MVPVGNVGHVWVRVSHWPPVPAGPEDLHLQPQGHVSLEHAAAGSGHPGRRHLLLGGACSKKGEGRGWGGECARGRFSLPSSRRGSKATPSWATKPSSLSAVETQGTWLVMA